MSKAHIPAPLEYVKKKIKEINSKITKVNNDLEWKYIGTKTGNSGGVAFPAGYKDYNEVIVLFIILLLFANHN